MLRLELVYKETPIRLHGRERKEVFWKTCRLRVVETARDKMHEPGAFRGIHTFWSFFNLRHCSLLLLLTKINPFYTDAVYRITFSKGLVFVLT